jgi:hypothetical protein
MVEKDLIKSSNKSYAPFNAQKDIMLAKSLNTFCKIYLKRHDTILHLSKKILCPYILLFSRMKFVITEETMLYLSKILKFLATL